MKHNIREKKSVKANIFYLFGINYQLPKQLKACMSINVLYS